MNPIPLTLALAPFDRVETVELVARRIVALRAELSGEMDNESTLTNAMVTQRAKDLDAELIALQALLELARASTGDTIFLSTHAFSLLA